MNDFWWKGAVFYQIYPRSFRDTNHDGVGDLNGITEKLEYVADLGVDAIWISPFFKSPMKDFGYDISDLCDIDPMFGVLADFDNLLNKAHRLGLKVIIDMVLSHTSKRHPWFEESRKDGNNPKRDWYVWADPKPDGTPPNNWRSIFGGEAWTFDTRRRQYYMHNFLPDQPDLNYHNPDVQDAILESCRFWLDKGVDGFRLDVINFIYHDKQLRDNPAKDPEKEGFSSQFEKPDPYGMQRHIYNKSQPEALDFARRFRKMMNEYPGTMTLAEIGDDDSTKRATEYTSGNDKYNTAYDFSLMTGERITAPKVKKAIESFGIGPDGGWPSWAFTNHDVVRATSRWGGHLSDEQRRPFASLLMAILPSLIGTVFIYQGDELGLTEAEIPYDQIQDPWGKYLWPEWQGRDGCRTPMPWNSNKKNCDFSDADETWLPIPDDHYRKAVNLQEESPNSPLAFTRRFLAWRRKQPALITGTIKFFDMKDDNLLCFGRYHNDQNLLCLFNLEDKPKQIAPPLAISTENTFPQAGNLSGTHDGKTVSLPAFGVYFGRITEE
ncbi:MAG: alpha-glucosidase family protein [Alphaproteobacteria bacterium]|nr:alpha-glucosidase family protein [Alphaproteobacteria bacterium]MCD8571272.1 alpha-glucosidase family protein [Alphaproteobacteria bacterium]